MIAYCRKKREGREEGREMNVSQDMEMTRKEMGLESRAVSCNVRNLSKWNMMKAQTLNRLCMSVMCN
jgi:hypothetical protein